MTLQKAIKVIITPDLKKCPFCGLKDSKSPCLRGDTVDARSRFYYVLCRYCGAKGGDSRAKREAIRTWNRRAQS
ncbi:MAG: Lar family restriction alleviation protein [Faecousia sp.]